MTDQYTDIRAAVKQAIAFGPDCYTTVNSATIRALLAERDAKDAEIATLRHALRKSAAVLSGLEMNKSALVHALELALVALAQQEQSWQPRLMAARRFLGPDLAGLADLGGRTTA